MFKRNKPPLRSLLRSGADLDGLLRQFQRIVTTATLPTPGHQAAWLAATSATAPHGVPEQASDAMRRLLDAGASPEDVLSVARGVAASVVMDALTVLANDEGELAGDFHMAVTDGLED